MEKLVTCPVNQSIPKPIFFDCKLLLTEIPLLAGVNLVSSIIILVYVLMTETIYCIFRVFRSSYV